MVASPWLDIPLADYEGHMALPEIAQARMLADELEIAVRQHTPSSVAIIGCSGGNGFERLIGTTVERVVGLDINPTYVAAAQARFGTRMPKLALYVADIQDSLPNIMPVDMIFAGLIFEVCGFGYSYAQLAETLRTGRNAGCGPTGTKRGGKGIAISVPKPTTARTGDAVAPSARGKSCCGRSGACSGNDEKSHIAVRKIVHRNVLRSIKGGRHNGLDYL